MNYHHQPNVSESTFARVTQTLAQWLPADTDGAALATWQQDEWLTAEWLTYWQCALPWFVRRLRTAKIVAPAAIQTRLDKIDRDVRQRSLIMLEDAVMILRALQTARIPAIPLKGAVLAPLYFPDPSIRPFGDLDILIDPSNSQAVAHIMYELGYRLHKRTAKDDVYLIGARNYENVWSPDNVRPIEIQMQPLNQYGGLRYDMTALLHDGLEETVYWNGLRAAVPNKIVLLHHVCAHATEDWLMRRGKLMQIYDVQQLVGRFSAEDWQAFLHTVPPHGARFIYPTLALLHRYTPVAIPEFVLNQLADNTPAQLRNWVTAVPFGTLFERRSGKSEWQELKIGRLLARNVSDQATILRHLILPPRHHFRLKDYPDLVASPWWPLAYVRLNFDRARQLLSI